MNILTMLMPFLYFPEDKTEYIPAAISMAVGAVVLIFLFRWLLKFSKKQERKAAEIEARVMKDKNINQ